tara:strand:- start:251 stop:733 length:483 start_codon:yes stop_codon:yes gene_type:complete
MAWTEQRVEQLKKLWTEGLSASQIAKRLGEVTRNAVIGKVHRLGLEARAKPQRKNIAVGQLDGSVVSVSYSGNLAFKKTSEDDIEYSKNHDLIQSNIRSLDQSSDQFSVTILNLSENNCKWPLGDPGADDFHFCGHQPLSGMPYCEQHAKKAYKKFKVNS